MLQVWLTDVFKTREDARIVFLLSTSSYPWCHDQGDCLGLLCRARPLDISVVHYVYLKLHVDALQSSECLLRAACCRYRGEQSWQRPQPRGPWSSSPGRPTPACWTRVPRG